MTQIQIEEPARPANSGFVPFALGFRPFFLGAGILAVLYMVLWLGVYLDAWPLAQHYQDALSWHRHEMVFGYGLAVVAGFLLTAVRNWTNLPTPAGTPLALLFLLWLMGRVLAVLPVPGWVLAIVDGLFPLILALVLFIPIAKARQHHNQIFPVILVVITVADVLMHLQYLGITHSSAESGLQLALLSILWIMAIMGGRVIPFFIERAIPGFKRRSWSLVEKSAGPSIVALMAAVLLQSSTATIVTAVLAAVIHGVRVFGWHDRKLWSVPLLWVLWLGYAWIVIGFALHAVSAAGLAPPALALHAYGVGGMGVLTLGMMARVALGHTGRNMQLTTPWMVGSFALLALAALVRVFGPMLPFSPQAVIGLSGVLWVLAFVIFVWVYTPILMRPRIDGRPG
ncbi:MAG: NnrS family protein [Pseudomonadota bacterium]